MGKYGGDKAVESRTTLFELLVVSQAENIICISGSTQRRAITQLSLVFNHEWQQVLHTSQPENVPR